MKKRIRNMPEAQFHHSEALLQWIWENLLFDFTDLETTCGKNLSISDPGILNHSDGPDFKQCVLDIDGIRWYGDIEIHTKARNWYGHNHQNDNNYNSVVLHVIADYDFIPVTCSNGSQPYTLNLLPYLQKEFHLFLKNFEHPSGLPCASSLSYISEQAFHQQIDKAHREYFEKKSSDFLKFYDPGKLPSEAWKHALVISLFDGFGISHNREAMQQVATELLDYPVDDSLPAFTQQALDIAGFNSHSSSIRWNYKSVHPNNHPKKRIEQAAELAYLILNEPFGNFLSPKSLQLWQNWTTSFSSTRTGILYGTVFLPSLYMLGNLFTYNKLSEAVFSEWLSLKTPVPSPLLQKFRALNLSDKSYRKKLGSVHQLRSYCNTGKCSECLVLKNAIQS